MGDVLDELWAVALDQHGYVTSKDATGAGVDPLNLVKLGGRGTLRRVAHGVYRFSEDRIPVDEWDLYELATLWPAGRGVLSHDTALQLHEICDVNPAKIHVTVPRAYRVRKTGGESYEIHRVDLAPEELTWVEGVRIVTPSVAIAQGLATGTALHLLQQAIDSSAAKGLVPREVLDDLQGQLDGVQ